MVKRVVLFLILALAIIVGYDYVLKQMGIVPSSPQRDQPPPLEAPTVPAKVPEFLGVPPSEISPDTLGSARLDAKEKAARSPVDEQTYEVVTDLFRAVFTNRGAVLKGWELKRYSTKGPNGPQPVQLMYAGGKFRGPLSLQVTDSAISKQLSEGLYQVEQDFSTLDEAHPDGHLTFTYLDPRVGLRIEKQLTFHHRSYLVDVSVRADGLSGAMDIGLGTNFGIVEWGEGFIGLIGPASLVDDKIEKDTPDGELERKGLVRWVALQDKYFLSVLIPAEATAALIKKEGEKLVSAGIRVAQRNVSSPLKLQLYAGPKEFDTLKSLNIGLEDTIDFGWFIYGSWSFVKFVAKPIFYILRFIYDYTGNYGVTIILLTVGIKLLFVPLQYKSYKSMKDMQGIQPKVVAMQAKYKDDRERLNRELIKVYRDHKVNPVGGCLPMFLQMPVFVALFNVLYMTIDLRQAPFMLWVTDLSLQDPYYVLPVIMGVTMFIQQKITPTTMDPAQAKIMLVLPIGLTFLFVNFPAGLVLYWLTNNVLTITQQLVTDRFLLHDKALASMGAEQSGSTSA